jgi:hypothetical protein
MDIITLADTIMYIKDQQAEVLDYVAKDQMALEEIVQLDLEEAEEGMLVVTPVAIMAAVVALVAMELFVLFGQVVFVDSHQLA